MKYFSFFSIFLLLINIIYAENENNNNKKENNKSLEEDYYLVFVNNTHGEFKIYSESKHEKRAQSQIFIESLIDEINNLIVDNLGTYQYPEKLEEFEITSKLKKRTTSSQSNFFNSNSDY
ncbi:hypothetical protein BCR32DRAFT_287877 [Anaeromyces robustus]|uniref:Uncharacterized protein n=1 Tax=Anaeromyces robustus TaxID=1754192 RepID=A0A1Y1VRC7_9FUNG|nr:hypothetical protein BCR32DRAFT_287877 [Anaeromyces robustus]|eukprot:ORX63294.1 hypothetical protein BCR32DRAFT_287877 [Anaeromyces robustus]